MLPFPSWKAHKVTWKIKRAHTQIPFSVKLREGNIHQIQNTHKAPERSENQQKPCTECHEDCQGA